MVTIRVGAKCKSLGNLGKSLPPVNLYKRSDKMKLREIGNWNLNLIMGVIIGIQLSFKVADHDFNFLFWAGLTVMICNFIAVLIAISTDKREP